MKVVEKVWWEISFSFIQQYFSYFGNYYYLTLCLLKRPFFIPFLPYGGTYPTFTTTLIFILLLDPYHIFLSFTLVWGKSSPSERNYSFLPSITMIRLLVPCIYSAKERWIWIGKRDADSFYWMNSVALYTQGFSFTLYISHTHMLLQSLTASHM